MRGDGSIAGRSQHGWLCFLHAGDPALLWHGRMAQSGWVQG